MKWWAQSFLVGVPKITCGFRNDDGVVKVLQTFKTAEIPHETQVIYNTIAGKIGRDPKLPLQNLAARYGNTILHYYVSRKYWWVLIR